MKICFKIDKSKLFGEKVVERINFENVFKVSGSGFAVKKNKIMKFCQSVSEVLDSLQCSFLWNFHQWTISTSY